jgi:hypothetical protein
MVRDGSKEIVRWFAVVHSLRRLSCDIGSFNSPRCLPDRILRIGALIGGIAIGGGIENTQKSFQQEGGRMWLVGDPDLRLSHWRHCSNYPPRYKLSMYIVSVVPFTGR